MTTPSLKVPIVAIDQFATPLRNFANRINSLTQPIVNMENHLHSLRKAGTGVFAALGRPFKPITDPFKHVFGGMGGVASIAGITAAGAGLFKLTSGTAEYADNLDKAAFKLGLTVGGLQKLQYAAKMSDISVEDFDGSMTKFTKTIGDAASGDAKKGGLFKALGIDLKKSKDTQTVLLQVASALSKVKSASERNRVLIELFGKSGANMAEFFRGGSEEIERLMTKREKYGLMTDADIQKGKDFSQTWKDFTSLMEGARNTLGMELMPGMTEGIQKLGSMIVQNMPQIKKFAKEMGSAFSGENIKNFIGYLSATGELFNNLIIKPLMAVAKWSKHAGEVLADIAHPELYETDPKTGLSRKINITPERINAAKADIAAGGFAEHKRSYAEIQAARLEEAKRAVAQPAAARNTSHTNQAYLEIKVSPDGSFKTNMLGNLGKYAGLGWSMVQ